MHVTHSIDPTYDNHSRVLVLGSMPSPASRDVGFNYGHPRNRFWQVMAQLANEPLPTTNERKRDFCLRHHIALWDVLAECDIEGASDSSIRNAKPNDLALITKSAPIEAVFCTGAKAYELYNRLCANDTGIPAVKLPSTSPANAACSLETLLEEYAAILEHEHAFVPPSFDVPQVIELEQTIAASGTPLSELMDRAGGAVAHRVVQVLEELREGAYPSWDSKEQPLSRKITDWKGNAATLVTILCGNGNNGGDGWVAAKLLAQQGISVCLVTAKVPCDIKAQPAHDAATWAFDALTQLGARVIQPAQDSPFQQGEALEPQSFILVDDDPDGHRDAVEDAIAHSAVVVDSIMGTGQVRTPRTPFLEWIESANSCVDNHASLAVDVPTGIDAQTGIQATPHIIADETITMIAAKSGLDPATCGRISVAPLAYIENLVGD